MSEKSAEKGEMGRVRTATSYATGEAKNIDDDARKLEEMGYKQEVGRNYSVLSLLGVAFSLTSSWFGISAGLVTGISSGGPLLVIYGIILLTVISSCVGISLSELASSMPNAGGQYFWVSQLAPKRYASFLSYATGWTAWAGALFTSASICLGLGSAIMGCIQLAHPDLIIKPWMVFVGYQVVNILGFFMNCYGKALPYISTATLWISLTSFVVILITVPATADTHQDAKFVFATFVNNTGWQQNGIAFIVGLINTNWAFACLDCATHLAEEVSHPERTIPLAIMGTVAIGFITSWLYSISMFFSMNNLDELFTTATGVPMLALFEQALNHRAGAIVLEALIIATGMGCLAACHTWQSRLCWSFARDGGVPCSKFLAKVVPGLDVPINAHVVSCVIVSALGCLYLGSYTAFNSMVTACIVLLYVSYALPVGCLLVKGRNSLTGPFSMGALGLVSNIVLLMWTLFTLVMFSFPAVMPVAADNMNYVCAVYAIVATIITIDWFVRGKRTYKFGGSGHSDDFE